MEAAAISGSSKRAKAPGNIAQVAHCLVDGCNADLSQCREYHRRHKVCEMHSKTPKVTIGGREQRFCQQCSRIFSLNHVAYNNEFHAKPKAVPKQRSSYNSFHALTEFDEGKRSCRKRLDGHNRRRRKPQPESLSRSPSLFFSSQPGTRLLSFGSRETFTSGIVSSTWAGLVNSDNDMMMFGNQSELNYIVRQNSLSEAPAHGCKGGDQFQFMQGTERVLPEASMRQPLLDPSPASTHSNCSPKEFSDGFLNQVIDSDRALSLLSSAPAVREIGLSHMVRPNFMHHSRSMAHNLHFGRLGHYPLAQEIQSKPVVSVTDSQVSNHSNLHFQEMFQNGPDESSTSGSQQTLTFMWE